MWHLQNLQKSRNVEKTTTIQNMFFLFPYGLVHNTSKWDALRSYHEMHATLDYQRLEEREERSRLLFTKRKDVDWKEERRFTLYEEERKDTDWKQERRFTRYEDKRPRILYWWMTQLVEE